MDCIYYMKIEEILKIDFGFWLSMRHIFFIFITSNQHSLAVAIFFILLIVEEETQFGLDVWMTSICIPLMYICCIFVFMLTGCSFLYY